MLARGGVVNMVPPAWDGVTAVSFWAWGGREAVFALVWFSDFRWGRISLRLDQGQTIFPQVAGCLGRVGAAPRVEDAFLPKTADREGHRSFLRFSTETAFTLGRSRSGFVPCL